MVHRPISSSFVFQKTIENKDAPYRPLLVAISSPKKTEQYDSSITMIVDDPLEKPGRCDPWTLTEKSTTCVMYGLQTIWASFSDLLFIEHILWMLDWSSWSMIGSPFYIQNLSCRRWICGLKKPVIFTKTVRNES